MPSKSEKSPLLATGSPRSYYFLKGEPTEGQSTAVRDADGGEVIEVVPEGATEDDFASRAISPSIKRVSSKVKNISMQLLLGYQNIPTLSTANASIEESAYYAPTGRTTTVILAKDLWQKI